MALLAEDVFLIQFSTIYTNCILKPVHWLISWILQDALKYLYEEAIIKLPLLENVQHCMHCNRDLIRVRKGWPSCNVGTLWWFMLHYCDDTEDINHMHIFFLTFHHIWYTTLHREYSAIKDHCNSRKVKLLYQVCASLYSLEH